MNAYYTGETDYLVPTGEYVSEWLDEHGMTRTELARRMGVSRKHVQQVIAGAPVTADFAQKLDMVTGVPARRWLQLEATYQADKTRLATVAALQGYEDLVDAVVPLASALRREGVVSATRRQRGMLLLEVLTFFGLGSADELRNLFRDPVAAFRQTTAFDTDEVSVAGWLRLGELQVGELLGGVPLFRAPALREAIPELRTLSRAEPPEILPRTVRRLAELGVLLIFVPEVPGCRAYGATRWFGGTPVIQLSMRGKDDGNFWFTLFHEIGHILLRPREQFLDGLAGAEEAEAEADQFARETLVPVGDEWTLDECRSLADVQAVAEALGVSEGIVVGRLHRDKRWHHSRGQNLFVRFQFADEHD